jgi:GTP-binding protein EngB required for normal cell division
MFGTSVFCRLFLEKIHDWGKKVIIVVNKMDIISDEDRAAVLSYVTEQVSPY